MSDVQEPGIKQLPDIDRKHVAPWQKKAHKHTLLNRLKELRVYKYNMKLPETYALPLVIEPEEEINGIVYGKYKQETPGKPIIGRGALIATNRRIILLDRKPLYLKCHEISYMVISAVSYSSVGFSGTVILYTRLGNISVKTYNSRCARTFVEATEEKIFNNQQDVIM